MMRASRLSSRHRPRAFRDAGWMQARLLGPDVLPVPAGGTDADIRRKEPPKPEPVKTSITVVEKISAETPANVTMMDSIVAAGEPRDESGRPAARRPGLQPLPPVVQPGGQPHHAGISLRGIGSSGASRTLVLWDGIPANDPFGGWVYWTQFVPDEIGARGDFARRRHQHFRRSRHERRDRDIHAAGREAARARPSTSSAMTRPTISPPGFRTVWSRMAISGSARAFTSRWLLHRARQHSRRRGHAGQRASSSPAMCARSVHVDRRFLFQDEYARRRAAERHRDHAQFDGPGHPFAALRARVHQRFLLCTGLPHAQRFSRHLRQRHQQSQYGPPDVQPDRAERCGGRRLSLAASRQEVEPAWRAPMPTVWKAPARTI